MACPNHGDLIDSHLIVRHHDSCWLNIVMLEGMVPHHAGLEGQGDAVDQSEAVDGNPLSDPRRVGEVECV